MGNEITRAVFGKTRDGQEVDIYTIKSADGMEAKIMTYGAAVVSLLAPDKTGAMRDIVLGCDTVKAYEEQDKFFGAVIGRCANRIAGGRFSLNGKEYTLACNNGANHLHGGPGGFSQRIWDAKIDGDSLVFSIVSEDGDEGYPGRLEAQAVYTLGGGSLELELAARADADTPVNLTNHSYFNLDGEASGSAMGQKMQIFANSFTPVDSGLIPTGEIVPVDGTPMDFREAAALGERIDADDGQLKYGGGYDLNFALNGSGLKKAAQAFSEESGIMLTLYTTLPGIQLYSGNFLNADVDGKNGLRYAHRSAFCLEPQYFPNAVNCPGFKSPTLKAGEEYRETIRYDFSLIG